jgi:putative inorganic carbon (HCO3(-)) transporter
MQAETLRSAQPDKGTGAVAWGLLTGLTIAVLLAVLPAQTAAKYILAVGAAVLIFRQPLLGLYFFLAGLAFLPTLYAGQLLLGTAAVYALRRALAGQRMFSRTPVDLPLAVFFTFVVLAALFSVARAGSLAVLPLYGLFFLAFYLMYVLPRPADVAWLLGGLLLAGAVTALLAWLQYKSGVQTSLSWIDIKQAEVIRTRVFATFENPNIYAEYLTFVIPPALVLFVREKHLPARFVWGVVLASAGVALVLTMSRGAWLAVGLAFLLLGLFWERRLLCVIAAGVLLLPILAPEQVLTRAASIGSLEDSSNAFRLSIWFAVVRMIAAYWLTGIGLGAAAFGQVYPQFMLAGTPALHSHNLYLELALQLGVPGLVAFLWLLLAVFSRAARAVPRLKAGTRSLLIALIAGLSGFLLHGAVDNVWYSPKLTFLFWAVLGLALALTKEADDPAGTAHHQ